MSVAARLLSLFAALAVVAGPVTAAAGEARSGKTVIELFTSQGCSSCPKADKLLGELAADPRYIALSLSVDYWDYLGWRDTLALHAHSMRQKGYANHRGDRNVYTPQMVMNGVTEAIGNKRSAIERAVGETERQDLLVIPVALKRNTDNVEIEVGAGNGPNASIWIISVLSKSPVTIERGENRGKSITYHNVVRGWTRLADWNGVAVKKSHAIAELTQGGADTVVVVVQNGSVEAPGAIRGAAMLPLR
ncbi:MAG TPA: DUF1223 domain-containing protein [Xanthobacteraceae bacterium]|nr:DUF1223 domain-containing protein [Xanthobacteraceae bacterium]